MVVIKILEGVLSTGDTSITFTDSEIPNSIISVNCSDPELYPVSKTLSGNTLTLTYEAQSTNKAIAVSLLKNSIDIIDDLESEDADKALSANQGYILKGLIDDIVIPTVPENITDLDDVAVSSIQNGQVLAWNSTSEKFENVNQSGGGSETYTTDETIIGTYLGETLYRKVITGLSLTATWVNQYYPRVNTTNLIPDAKEVINARAIQNYSSQQSRGSHCSIFLSNAVGGGWTVIVADDITINTLIVEYTKTS